MDGLEKYEKRLEQLGYEANHKIGFGNAPHEIARVVKDEEIDFLVMGVHGHKGIEDVIFGTTLDAVRHKTKVPILIVNS
ncbi:universal stress protein [Zobellia nedashkovskayae]|uniref:universal stress protein n=1 Tax=Zobellia nedashkovskayae TaxID=2779510 RepID=UPI00188B76F1|nr:universal stress protein [Zobellia nedashkovskayae]